ncbi:Retinoblastoma-associated protein [Oryzias melastigma]|uniref:Retinoblastoma-associated protein n=1 Tax=Oryzias melastigma TaxID=30732 RepID=A0A834CGR1_ORYME|nr:Retinoblastoma-associated protein [Oryzias melastigma]
MPPKKRNSGTAQSNKELKPSSDRSFPDKKGSPEFSQNKHTDKDVEFVTLSKSLHVTDSVCERAWTLWKTVQDLMEDVAANQKKLWGACLFVTATDMDAACFTLTEVLKEVDINVKQFLSLVRRLDVNLDTISTKVNSALTRVEKKYDVMLALYQRFEKTCKKIFVSTPDEKERATLRTCWTMFLLAKGQALQMEDDLVISFQLLLCTLELFIKRSSPELLLPLYKSVVSKAQSPLTRTSRRNQSKTKSRVVESEVNVELLETLCKDNECNSEEVKNVYQTSFSAFLDQMDLSRFPDFPLVTDVNQQYQEHYLKSRDIDGRLFFDGDETVLVPKVDILQVERTPKKTSPDDDGPIIPPQTPIRAAMNSIKMLRGDLPSSGDQPSSKLATYFKNCTVDPTQGIQKRLEMLGQVFSQMFGEAVGPHCIAYGRERFNLGVRLYYKVMEAMLESEEKRLSVQNFSKLLNDSTFHTSLLACALEVVMATYEESSFKNGGCSHGEGEQAVRDLCFPWILNVFDLSAFDFYKVIESFIKAEPTLSKEIIKHLETCENFIMEKIAWRTVSFTNVSLNRRIPHVCRLLKTSLTQIYLSPIRPGLRVLPPESPATPSSQASSQANSQAVGQAPRQSKSNSLSLFYKKLYRLAYTRLKTLCSCLLSNHPDLEHVIWTLFQHTLQYEYDLMRDRHLDQLMMSAMYAICKVKSVDLRFKSIVSAYKNMPNTSQETFKHVLITEGQYDSIIVFYNQVFMQKLKTNILQYASTRPPTLSPIPQIPCSPYKFPNSPLRVPGSNNVYISPLKNPRMSPGMMTPRSRSVVNAQNMFQNCLLFANRFQKINQMVNSSDRAHKRTLDGGSALKTLKRLRFDMDGQDEADGSKSGGESALIQKLAEMSSTRNRMQEQKMKEDAESRKKSP